MKYIIILFLLASKSYAYIDIAFIELRNHEGKIIQLEPGGSYAHIAISYQGQWLHSYPFRGVEIISTEDLEKIGVIKEVVRFSEFDSITKEQVSLYLGKPYDPDFSWNEDKIYCSELIGKLLKIPPLPMKFEAAFWRGRFGHLKSQLGLSPDDIFQFIASKRHKTQNQCSKVFN